MKRLGQIEGLRHRLMSVFGDVQSIHPRWLRARCRRFRRPTARVYEVPAPKAAVAGGRWMGSGEPQLPYRRGPGADPPRSAPQFLGAGIREILAGQFSFEVVDAVELEPRDDAAVRV